VERRRNFRSLVCHVQELHVFWLLVPPIGRALLDFGAALHGVPVVAQTALLGHLWALEPAFGFARGRFLVEGRGRRLHKTLSASGLGLEQVLEVLLD